VGIYIWPWVLGLALLEEDWWYDVIQLGNELEEFVVGQVLESKFSLTSVTGISLTKHSMAVTGNNSTSLKGIPDELTKMFVRDFIRAQISDKLSQPNQNFLVSQSV